ncbi:MAG: DUF350 domain-containing protein [Rhodothalassiaceae bacterium]
MMEAVLDSLKAGFPVFLAHSALSLALLVAAIILYMRITPHDELALVRKGNRAAALSLSGAIVGLALPLAFTLSGSVGLFDILLWSLVTLGLQIIAFRIVDLLLRDLPKRIEADDLAAAIFLVGAKLATAMINAAAIAV